MIVVTGFSKDGYEQYGRNFVQTFTKFRPDGLGLVVYVDDYKPFTPPYEWIKQVTHDQLRGVREFVERNKNIPEHCGKSPVPGWRHKDERVGYSYRYDAVRFCWQLFYPEHASESLPDGEILVWFDGDVIFHDNISTSYIDTALQGHDLAYLGRRTHTELGFWAVRLNNMTRSFLFKLAEAYRSNAVFRMPEWHSAAVFDFCLKDHPLAARANSLTAGDAGNVWERTPLRRFSTHLKGKLKEQHVDNA